VRPPGSALLWLSALAFTAGALTLVDEGPDRAEGAFDAGSVFTETPEGLSLAHRYLQERESVHERDGDTLVLSRRLSASALPADGVLFRMRPRLLPPPSSNEDAEDDAAEDPGRQPAPASHFLASREEAWVRDGGRLVLGLDADYGPLFVGEGEGGDSVRKVFPLWPGVASLEPGEVNRQISGGAMEPTHAVFVQGASPLLSRLVIGKGEVLLLAVPELLENGHLAEADHLALLEALAGVGRPVAFDEWTHGLGQDEGLVELLLDWNLGPALLVAALAFALALWRGRSRLGPEEDDAAEERSEAVDLVDSLSQLYDRALTRREAAVLHRDGFRRAVGLRTGLRGAALERRALELLGAVEALPAEGAEMPATAFLRALSAVNDGYRRLHEHAHTRRRP